MPLMPRTPFYYHIMRVLELEVLSTYSDEALIASLKARGFNNEHAINVIMKEFRRNMATRAQELQVRINKYNYRDNR